MDAGRSGLVSQVRELKEIFQLVRSSCPSPPTALQSLKRPKHFPFMQLNYGSGQTGGYVMNIFDGCRTAVVGKGSFVCTLPELRRIGGVDIRQRMLQGLGLVETDPYDDVLEDT